MSKSRFFSVLFTFVFGGMALVGIFVPVLSAAAGTGEASLVKCRATPDDGTTVYVSANAHAIQQAVDNAALGSGTVKITGDCIGVETVSGSDQSVYISADVTIWGGFKSTDWTAPEAGNRTAIDGNSLGRVIYVPTGRIVTLLNLVITNGNISGNGGALYVEAGGTLTVNDTFVVSSTASASGGGLYNEGTALITGSVVADNNAADGAGAAVGAGTLTVFDSYLRHNTATASGGALFATGSGALELDGSTLAYNTGVDGGALAVAGSATMVGWNSTLSTNTGTNSAGGVYVTGSAEITLTNATINENTGGGLNNAATTTLYNTLVTNEVATGADCTNSGTLTANNKNMDTDGSCSQATTSGHPRIGDLADNGGPTTPEGVIFTHSLLNGSAAMDKADTALCAATPISNLDQRNVTRPTDGDGDDIADCDIGAYEAPAATCFATPDDGITIYRSGDATAVQRAVDDVALGSGTIKVAGFCPGTEVVSGETQSVHISAALTLAGGYTNTVGGWTTSDSIANPTVIDGDQDGHVVYVTGAIAATIQNITLTNGALFGNGGGIYNDNSRLTLDNVKVTHNLADSTFFDGEGGGLYQIGTTAATTLTNNTLFDANMGEFGGGIMIWEGDAFIDNSTFTNNSASYNGGGVFLRGFTNTLTIDSSVFDANNAQSGGGVYFNSAVGTIKNSTVSNNTTTGFGAGIYANFSDIGIYTNTISNNSATGVGGGVYNFEGVVDIQATTISGNSGLHGAGYYGRIATDVAKTSAPASSSIGNSTISGNNAAFDGGGVYLYNGELDIKSSTLYANSAITTGGNIKLINDAELTFKNSIVAAAVNGGDCSGTVTTNGFNIDGDGSCVVDGVLNDITTASLMLSALQDNGGTTLTHIPLTGSPAVDSGSNAACAAAPINNIDQRGALRPDGTTCDRGAVEGVGSSVPTAVNLAVQTTGAKASWPMFVALFSLVSLGLLISMRKVRKNIV